MNTKKIEQLLGNVANLIDEDLLTSQEYLVFVANLLFSFGYSAYKNDNANTDINFRDSNSVEIALNQDPNNVYLASILQSHILIKWSEGLKNE